jgi:hypothetical protein
MERFGKGSQLVIASEMIEVLLSLPNRSCWTDLQAILTGATVFGGRSVYHEREVSQDSNETNPCPILLVDKEVIPSDPSQSCCSGNVLMRGMTSLLFPIHDL